MVKFILEIGGLYFIARWFGGFGIGAPYLPAKPQHIKDALTLAHVGPDDVVLDLGSGDGRVMLAAVKIGARVIGYEINPFLAGVTRFRLRAYKDRARTVAGNLFEANLKDATVIFIFGITKLMPKVADWIKKEARPGTRVVSLAFDLPGLVFVSQLGAVKRYRVD